VHPRTFASSQSATPLFSESISGPASAVPVASLIHASALSSSDPLYPPSCAIEGPALRYQKGLQRERRLPGALAGAAGAVPNIVRQPGIDERGAVRPNAVHCPSLAAQSSNRAVRL
jgi:hypothetical protein